MILWFVGFFGGVFFSIKLVKHSGGNIADCKRRQHKPTLSIWRMNCKNFKHATFWPIMHLPFPDLIRMCVKSYSSAVWGSGPVNRRVLMLILVKGHFRD